MKIVIYPTLNSVRGRIIKTTNTNINTLDNLDLLRNYILGLLKINNNNRQFYSFKTNNDNNVMPKTVYIVGNVDDDIPKYIDIDVDKLYFIDGYSENYIYKYSDKEDFISFLDAILTLNISYNRDDDTLYNNIHIIFPSSASIKKIISLNKYNFITYVDFDLSFNSDFNRSFKSNCNYKQLRNTFYDQNIVNVFLYNNLIDHKLIELIKEFDDFMFKISQLYNTKIYVRYKTDDFGTLNGLNYVVLSNNTNVFSFVKNFYIYDNVKQI